MNPNLTPDFSPQQSPAELENQKIKKDFELAKKASLNLQFGGGVQQGEDGALFTKIANVFVHEGLPELEKSPLQMSYLGGDTPARFFYGTPQSEAERSKTMETIEFFLGLPEDETGMVAIVEQSQGFKEWVANEAPSYGYTPEKNYPIKRLCDAYCDQIEDLIRENTSTHSERNEGESRFSNIKVAGSALLSILKSPENFGQVFSKYDEWAKNKFDKKSIPSSEDFDAFTQNGITPEAYLQMKLSQDEIATKEKIKRDPFVSKALSCIEVIDGKLRLQEGKDEVVRQLRQVYKGEATPERISLLLIGAKTLFSEISSKEEYYPDHHYANSLEEQVVTLITGQATYFKDFDHDGRNRYRTVFDPANIYKIETYSAKGNYPFHQAYAYAVYGQEGGDEVIKNLKYLGDVGEAQAVEEQLASKTRKLFETNEVGEKVAKANPAMFAYFKELVAKAEKLNSPNDTVLHHRYFASATVDEACATLAYKKTEGSTDTSPYSSNPSSSRSILVAWKDGKEKSFSADNVTSFELVSEGGQVKLIKHLNDGTTQTEIVE